MKKEMKGYCLLDKNNTNEETITHWISVGGARDVGLSTKSLLGFLWADFDETYIKKIASSRTIQINRSPVMILSL